MTKLPSTFVRAEALTFARAELAWYREHKIPILGIDVGVFDAEEGGRFERHAIKLYALGHPTHMMFIVSCAKAGWDAADKALRELIIEYEDRGEPKPTYLSAYAMGVIAQGLRAGGPGPKRSKFLFRDIAITVLVWKVAERFRLRPTRSRYSARISACSVVADALVLSEQAVVTIWTRYGAPNLTI
jgi:hypothetical protein